VAALAALLGLPAPGIAQGATGSQTYSTAGEHVFTVPAGVTSLQVTLIGGNGGGGRYPTSTGGAGGQGATVTGTLAVTPGESLFAEVAGNGENGYSEGSGGGGSGGGGTGGEIFFVKGGGGGGGASDLRTCGLKCAGPSLPTRLLVAGGGGGGGGEGSPTAVTGGSGGSADRSGTAGSKNGGVQGGEGGKRATTSGGGARGEVSFECGSLGCSQAGTEAAGGGGGVGIAGGGGGGGGGGIFGGGGGGGGEAFKTGPGPSEYQDGGGGGGGGGSSGVPAAAAGRVTGFLQLLTALGAEPSISISWTIPPTTVLPPASPAPSPSGVTGSPGSLATRTPVPSVGGLTVSPQRFRRGRHAATISRASASTGTTIAFTLAYGATVTLGFEQPRKGLLSGGRCLAPSPAHRRGRSCTRFAPVAQAVVRQGHAGSDRIHFEGVLDGGFRMAPGAYRLSLRATDAGGSATAPQHPSFTLLP
jgi:hypothetical protein